VADSDRFRELHAILTRLGYRSLPVMEHTPWVKAVPLGNGNREVKLDLLLGPYEAYRTNLKVRKPRVKPKAVGDLPLHSYGTDEALTIDDSPIRISLEGTLSDGSAYAGTVFVPEAFPYLLMKLHAYRDRRGDERKDLGRHHALDAYTAIGLATEAEYAHAVELARRHRTEPAVVAAAEIVRSDFSFPDAPGMLRLREHPLARDNLSYAEWMAVLAELFTP
jgi:hypothetical protein